MNESVRVSYPGASRDVFVDGAKCGATNTTFTVETGTHTFTLGPALDYTPRSVRVRVSGTTSLAPKKIVFQVAAA